MLPLDPSELSAARTDVTSTFSDTCSVLRNTPSPDGQGGRTASWATLAFGIACWVCPWSPPQELIQGAAIRAASYFQILLPYGQDVTGKDRIKVGALTYEVLGTDAPSSNSLNLTAFAQLLQ